MTLFLPAVELPRAAAELPRTAAELLAAALPLTRALSASSLLLGRPGPLLGTAEDEDCRFGTPAPVEEPRFGTAADEDCRFGTAATEDPRFGPAEDALLGALTGAFGLETARVILPLAFAFAFGGMFLIVSTENWTISLRQSNLGYRVCM